MGSTAKELIGSQTYQPGLTFVVHQVQGDDYFGGWNGDDIVKFGFSVKSWVACENLGQPSVAVLKADGTFFVWNGKVGMWDSLGSTATKLIGSQTYRPGLTFVVHQVQGDDYFGGWNGQAIIKLGHSATSHDYFDCHGMPSVKVKVGDKTFVWTGASWAEI